MSDNRETLPQAAPVESELKTLIHKIRSISMSGVPSPAKGYTIGDVVGQALHRITEATDEMLRVLGQAKVFQVTAEPLSDVERFTNEEFAHEVELAYQRIKELEVENLDLKSSLELRDQNWSDLMKDRIAKLEAEVNRLTFDLDKSRADNGRMIDDKMCSGCSSWPCQCLEMAQDRIKELEAELMEQARIVGMGTERELKLRTEFERLRAALENLVNSAVVKDAPFINYSEAYRDALEALK